MESDVDDMEEDEMQNLKDRIGEEGGDEVFDHL